MRLPTGPMLRDIHMPPPASWWPLAPGWWALTALLLIVIGLLAWHLKCRRLPRRRWREACAELDELLARHRHDSAALAAGVSQLQRRAARFNDPSMAGLSGDEWRAARQRLAGKRVSTQVFAGLDCALYQPRAPLDADALAGATRRWLRQVLLHGGRRA